MWESDSLKCDIRIILNSSGGRAAQRGEEKATRPVPGPLPHPAFSRNRKSFGINKRRSIIQAI